MKLISNLIPFPFCSSTLFAGFPEDGHKEERGTAEASKREIWHQHRPPKVTMWKNHPHLILLFPSVQTLCSLFYTGSHFTDTIVRCFFIMIKKGKEGFSFSVFPSSNLWTPASLAVGAQFMPPFLKSLHRRHQCDQECHSIHPGKDFSLSTHIQS